MLCDGDQLFEFLRRCSGRDFYSRAVRTAKHNLRRTIESGLNETQKTGKERRDSRTGACDDGNKYGRLGRR